MTDLDAAAVQRIRERGLHQPSRLTARLTCLTAIESGLGLAFIDIETKEPSQPCATCAARILLALVAEKDAEIERLKHANRSTSRQQEARAVTDDRSPSADLRALAETVDHLYCGRHDHPECAKNPLRDLATRVEALEEDLDQCQRSSQLEAEHYARTLANACDKRDRAERALEAVRERCARESKCGVSEHDDEHCDWRMATDAERAFIASLLPADPEPAPTDEGGDDA